MRRILNKLFILILTVILLNSNITCFAVEEVSENEQVREETAIEEVNENEQVSEEAAVDLETSKETVLTTKISFDEISEKAKNHSYDIKLADFDILISKQGIRAARSEYFPKLMASAGTEYTKNYNDIKSSIVTSVGEAFINPYTRFQSLFGITLSYNLFDFGIRRNNLDIEKADTQLKELLLLEKFQELDLTLIDTYSRLLMCKNQIEINYQILELNSSNLAMKQRLFDAQQISENELQEAVIAVKSTEENITELKKIAQETINWLSFYTGDNYDLENLVVNNLKRPNFNPMEFNDYTKSITWQIQEKELKKKELEVKIAKKNYLPKINAYSRYYMYGSDYSSYNDALKDLGPSNLTVGGNISMPIFDGFRISASVQNAELELKKQMVTRDKAIAELMNKLSIMRSNLIYTEQQTQIANDKLTELKNEEKNIKRLTDKKITSPIELNEAKIKVLNQKIEYDKYLTTSISILKAIQTLTTY